MGKRVWSESRGRWVEDIPTVTLLTEYPPFKVVRPLDFLSVVLMAGQSVQAEIVCPECGNQRIVTVAPAVKKICCSKCGWTYKLM